MKCIYIVGGDGFARECYLHIQTNYETVKFGGFLGHNGYGEQTDYKELQSYYKGDVKDFSFQENDYCIIGAGYPHLRKKIFNDLKRLNIKFYNLITKYCSVPKSIQMGEGNIIVSSNFTCNSVIGHGNLLNGEITTGHDCEIGDFNFIGTRTIILGNVKIGHHNFLGVNSIYLPKAKIGNGNKTAPLSVIYKGCKDNGYYEGNPALRIGVVEQDV